ncbi:unnamed protein product, partial [Iphiclides podalirius]
MFISSYRFKSWLRWSPLRGFLCSLAVAVGQGSTWRGPRAAFRHGGLVYALIATAASVALALPLATLQLAVGQLSQQDAVGVWGAVPFFKGVGYLRLAISMLTSIHTIIYVALITTYFFYTISNSIPFWECQYIVVPDETETRAANASSCFNDTFLAPVGERPEYFVALAMIVAVLSAALPLLLFGPLKSVKRLFYAAGPAVIVVGVAVLSSIGDRDALSAFHSRADVQSLLTPHAWYGTVVQALVASQTSNGYLILAGDTIYSNMDVQWTALVLVGLNVAAGWGGLLFWYAIVSPGELDTSPVAVLVETYRLAVERELNVAWPLLIFFMLFLSGIVTMLTLLYPIYDRCRRVGGPKWRYVAIGCSCAGAAGALAALAGGLPALSGIEDVAVPLLIGVATVLEVLAFLLIYGRKTLVEDVEFLIGGPMMRCWTPGWFAVPCAVLPLGLWWAVELLAEPANWAAGSRGAVWLVTAAGGAFALVLVFACAAVAQQVHYDALAKLQSSFRPSRHWGPRDPITHYYWLARREQLERNLPRTAYRRQLGRYSGDASRMNISRTDVAKETPLENKKRSNSDDWLFTVCRRSYLRQAYPQLVAGRNKRSKSLDWAASSSLGSKGSSVFEQGSQIIAVSDLAPAREINNNVSESNKNSAAVTR